MTGAIAHLPGATGELMPEKAVLNQWPCLSLEGLRAARAAGKIAWVKGKRGSAWYRPEAIRNYIREYLEKPCRAPELEPSSNSAAIGSPPSQGENVYTLSGLTPEMVEHAGRASAQRIFGKQK